jgi:hypothetical protein
MLRCGEDQLLPLMSALLARERRLLHRTIAEALETLYTSPLTREIQLADLAYHFYEAGIWTKALEYEQRVGEKALALFAPRAAIEHLTHALDTAHTTSAGLMEWQSMMALGFLWTERDYAQSGAWYRQALDIASRQTSPILHARSLNRFGNWLLNT